MQELEYYLQNYLYFLLHAHYYLALINSRNVELKYRTTIKNDYFQHEINFDGLHFIYCLKFEGLLTYSSGVNYFSRLVNIRIYYSHSLRTLLVTLVNTFHGFSKHLLYRIKESRS